MFIGTLLPLAPAAVLLLSAFILSTVVPRLPLRWQLHPGWRYNSVPALVGLAGITLLWARLALDGGPTPQVISSWNFDPAQPVTGLILQIDALNLPFLIVVLVLLLLVALLRFELTSAPGQGDDLIRVVNWLYLGAGTCLLLSAANGLTLAHAVVAFDTVAAFFGLRLGHGYLAMGATRIFLGVLTAAAILVTGLATPYGLFLLGLALGWRLGVMPFLEAAALAGWPFKERLVYQGLTLTVGAYLALRLVSEPLPELVRWFVIVLMLLAGLLAWLTSLDRNETEVAVQFRSKFLSWLVLTEALLLLLAGPLPSGAGVALVVGLLLSWLTLSMTPLLGLLPGREQVWFWPYLPAALATLTLIGAPFSLGWWAKLSIYESLLSTSNLALVLLTLAAEILAQSGLVRYWLTMVAQGHHRHSRRLHIAVLAVLLLLMPGLAPISLFYLTGLEVSISRMPWSVAAVVVLVVVPVVATVIGYQRQTRLARLELPGSWLDRYAYLAWLPGMEQQWFDRVSRGILRWRVITEGQHYLGWTIFTALMGALIILLSSASR